MEDEKELKHKYDPSKKDAKILKHVYDEFSDMLKVRNLAYKYFNDRTLLEFIDDSELRVTGFVPTREEQGKDDWQANVFHPTTRNKLEAILAAVALTIPDVKITAQDSKQMRDQKRAYVMRHLVAGSYDKENKEENIYFEAWECAVKGTVITYDGYLKQKAKRKIVKSVDLVTGKIEWEEEEVETKDECVDFIIPLENLFIKDIYIRDIQDQPGIAWVEKMSEAKFKEEFEGYTNYKYVKGGTEITQKGEIERYFKDIWGGRVTSEEPIEVVRYYNKFADEFIIVANGVLLLDAPMLLGKKEKIYPFAKTIFKAFASDFFYGNSLPNTLMGEQDVINALYNMALDKTYRSMVPPLLIGNKNKDDFDLEDDIVDSDTRIYVEDVQQVREMEIQGVDASMLKMMDVISRGLDMSSVDANQSGVTGKGVTAREVVIANENAKKLKGVLYMFLTALWIQKYKLRIQNILTYYTQPKVEKMVGDDGKETVLETYRKFMIENAELSDGTKGTLGVQMVGDQASLPSASELDVNEMMMQEQGSENYEEIAITSDYLDDWGYDVKVVSEQIYQTESSTTRAEIEDKLTIISKAFPQMFQLNQEKFFKDTLIAFEDDPDEYQTRMPAQAGMQVGPDGQPIQPGVEQATAGGAGLPVLPSV